MAETILQLRSRIDNWLQAKWPIVTGRQAIYYENKGKYWQGLITHSVFPSGSSTVSGDSIPDRITLHPSDQSGSWIETLSEWSGTNLPAAVKIDTYSGPQGDGYVASVFVKYNNNFYTKSQNVGPETYRTNSWAIYDPDLT